MKFARNKRLSKEGEHPILHFLWRWKVATTAGIYLRFEPIFKWTPFTAYQRMLKLESKGVVQTVLTPSRRYMVWSLTSAGFRAIQDALPLLKQEGYASESPQHDLFVLAAQYGDWLPKGTIDDVAFFTEQELRRQAGETLFSWLPPTSSHRPDGYWYFPNAKPHSLVSLEVEINRKAAADYKGYGHFYNRYKAIESVVWIVESRNLGQKIVATAQSDLGNFRDIHNFIYVKEFLEKGWSAKFFLGQNEKMQLRDFLNAQRLKQAETIPTPTVNHGLVPVILDERHRRFDTTAYAKSAPLLNR